MLKSYKMQLADSVSPYSFASPDCSGFAQYDVFLIILCFFTICQWFIIVLLGESFSDRARPAKDLVLHVGSWITKLLFALRTSKGTDYCLARSFLQRKKSRSLPSWRLSFDVTPWATLYIVCSFIILPHLRTGKKICVIRHAPGKGSCYVVAVAGEEVYVRAVDEAGFDEDGGHGSVAQDAEGGMGFYAAVFVACVKGGKAFYQLVLDAGRQSSARAALFVAVGFCAPPAAGVDVDAEEDIGGPVIGRVHDAGVAGGFAVEVMALQEFDF